MTVDEKTLQYIIKTQSLKHKDLQSEIESEISKPRDEQSEVYLRLLYGKKRGQKADYDKWYDYEHKRIITQAVILEGVDIKDAEIDKVSGDFKRKNYVTVKKLTSIYGGVFSQQSIYNHVLRNTNNITNCVRRLGTKYLIDLDMFDKWLENQLQSSKRKSN